VNFTTTVNRVTLIKFIRVRTIYSQYETTVMGRRRLHGLLAWVNQKYYSEYEVIQE